MSVPAKDRIKSEFTTLLDNFTNLVKAAKVQDPAIGQASVPGEMLEVFAEKMLASCHVLLAVAEELKRNALLNDVEERNAEVLATRRRLLQEAEELRRSAGTAGQQRGTAQQDEVMREASDVSIG